ncbi:MAG: tyrosine-protein phosphatase [Novosphingobium sp.]|nr:tyrosine-protein phosphatase [Novosphingobium sp.]
MDKDVAERLVPLEGGVNFRDMGGYETSDGRTVKWRHLYRSGTMHRLTPADHEHLATRGIRTVIDFRSGGEQVEEPNHWALASDTNYWSREHEEVFGNIHEMAASGLATPEDAMQVMEAGFRYLPFQQAEAYGEMFRRLAASEVPLAFHCTAGKDRTGGGAALILAALGVPRASIIADFTMTERAVDLQKALLRRKPNPKFAHFAELDEDTRAAFSGAKANYVNAFLDTIDEKCGSLENYLSDFGITQSDIGSIRASLLD